MRSNGAYDGLRTIADVRAMLETVTTLKALEELNDAVNERWYRDQQQLTMTDADWGEWHSLFMQKAGQLRQPLEAQLMSIAALDHRQAVGRAFAQRVRSGEAVFQNDISELSALPFTVSRTGESRRLTGGNLFVLLQAMREYGWTDPRFFTGAQAEEAGYRLHPDAVGIRVQYLVATEDGSVAEEPTVKTFLVFNASQIDGVTELEVPELPSLADIEEALQRSGLRISHDEQNRAYVDADASVRLPPPSAFSSVEEYLSVAVHEWQHALQGAVATHAQPQGAEIELRAEMASSLLSVLAQLPHDTSRHRGFGPAWAEAMERDPMIFFKAARDAERLASLVMWQVRQVSQEKTAEGLVVGALSGRADEEEGMVKVAAAEPATVPAWLERKFNERQAVLAVPWKEKDRAHEAGAIWYPPLKVWFVPKEADLAAFQEWNPHDHALGQTAGRQDLIDSFKKAMDSLGLDTSGEILDDGKWHYVRVLEMKKKNLSGAYVLNMDGGRDGQPVGTIQNKYSGEKHVWRYDGALLTPEQKAQLRAEALAREAAATREAAAAQDRAAVHAAEIMAVGLPAGAHGYVRKKGLEADAVATLRQVPGSVLLRYEEFHGDSGRSVIKEHEKYLIVPMYDFEGRLRAVQAINEDGSVKSFMRGAQKKGTMTVLGAESFAAVVAALQEHGGAVSYAEGIATGGSLRGAAPIPTIVCFDAGNLETVASEAAGKLPRGTVSILGADNDQFFVERAVGFVTDRLGLNPIARGAPGETVLVPSGAKSVREVALGEIRADGEWHQVAAGRYRISIECNDSGAVEAMTVEITKEGERAIRTKFENRGVTAAKAAAAAIEGAGGMPAVVVPEFASLKGRPTDWNDLTSREGRGVARSQVAAQLGALVQLPAPLVERERSATSTARLAVGVAR